MTPSINHRNRIVEVDQSRVKENALARTFLSADEAAGQTAVTVKDTGGFAVAKYVWFDPFGANSEIIAIHAPTTPTGNVITLATATAFAHSNGEEVLNVEFNQVEISHAATLTGTKTVLATEGMTAREKEHKYLDISQTTGFYFARYKDSVASTFGSYSDGVAYNGWANNSVGFMIDSALRELSLSFSEQIQMVDCLRWINKGMREIKAKVRRWPEHYIYNAIIGQAQRGTNIVAMPVDIYDSETNRSVESFRIGDGPGLYYTEPDIFDTQMGAVKFTDVRTEASAADTTLAVDNSYDYDDAGTVTVYVANVKHTITYTGITRSDTVGVLTGVPASGDGSISVTIPVDTKVWQDDAEGQPIIYTVRNGQFEFWPLVDAQNDNQNVYLDYNAEATEVDSEIDTIDYQRFDMLNDYLTWRLWCKAENGGELDKGSGFYQTYKEGLNDAVRTMPVLNTKTAPRINRMSRRGGRGIKPDPKLLPNDQQ